MSREEVQLLGAELQIDQTSYEDCPWCGRIGKMGITRNREGLLYNCFSTNCGARGFISDFPTYEDRPKLRTPAPRYRRWIGRSEQASPEDFAYFRERFGVDLGEWEILVTAEDEYLFPIRSRDQFRVGEVIRQPVWDGEPAPPRLGRDSQPKARTFLMDGMPRLSWFVGDRNPVFANSRIIVLTEDQISAAKVKQITGYTAIALLGNTLGPREAKEIAEERAEQVFIWLDPDMNQQAFKLNAEWGQVLSPLTRVIFSEKDPKDHDQYTIESYIYD